MKEKIHGWMYILLCADGSYYTGVQIIFSAESFSIRQGKVRIIRKKDFQLNLSILKSMNVLILLFTGRNRYRAGAVRKKEALINGHPELLPQLTMAYRDLLSEG